MLVEQKLTLKCRERLSKRNSLTVLELLMFSCRELDE